MFLTSIASCYNEIFMSKINFCSANSTYLSTGRLGSTIQISGTANMDNICMMHLTDLKDQVSQSEGMEQHAKKKTQVSSLLTSPTVITEARFSPWFLNYMIFCLHHNYRIKKSICFVLLSGQETYNFTMTSSQLAIPRSIHL